MNLRTRRIDPYFRTMCISRVGGHRISSAAGIREYDILLDELRTCLRAGFCRAQDAHDEAIGPVAQLIGYAVTY
jgi:hypothetical protein